MPLEGRQHTDKAQGYNSHYLPLLARRITFRQRANRMYHLRNRVAKLEQQCEGVDREDTPRVTYRLLAQGEKPTPGTWVLYLSPVEPGGWRYIPEEGEE